MSKQSIVIRADGGNTMGMGHIMRTSVLAHVLKEYAEVSYLCDEAYEQGINYLVSQGFDIHQVHKDKIIETIAMLNPDVLITDHYGVDQTYMENVRKYCNKVVYIDDNNEKKFDADLILNQNFGTEHLQYQIEDNPMCTMLLGSKYILVREAFRKITAITIKEKVRHILLTVGGGDPYNITGKILEKVCNLPYQFHVVIGGHFPYEVSVKKAYEGNTHIHWHHQPDMSELMSQVDLAISSCGSTIYELGLMGVPTLGVIVAANQSPLAERLQQAGVIKLLGESSCIEQMEITQEIVNLDKDYEIRQEMWSKNTQAFNRLGVYDIAHTILGL